MDSSKSNRVVHPVSTNPRDTPGAAIAGAVGPIAPSAQYHYGANQTTTIKQITLCKGKKDDSYYSKGKGKGNGKGKGKGDYSDYKKGKKDKSKDDNDGKKGKKQKKEPKCLTIGELAESSEDFTTLVGALNAVDLWEDVNDPEAEITIFAPTNNAFDEIPEGTIDLDDLLSVLLYHAVECKVTSSDLLGVGVSPITVPTALEDNTFNVVIDGHEIFIQGDANNVDDLPQVIEADIEACNGVVHVVDKIILPVLDEEPPVPTDPPILTIVENLPGFNTLFSILNITGNGQLIDDADDGPVTVFAPTDDAFAKLGFFLNYLAADPRLLSLVLQYHAVPGVLSAEFLSTDPPPFIFSLGDELIRPVLGDMGQLFLQGTNNDPNNLPMVGPVDITASNGIVHVIDEVLLPELPIAATLTFTGFSYLSDALHRTGLTAGWNMICKTLTVFAPTDAAFEALGQATLNAVFADIPLLTEILQLHVIEGQYLDSLSLVALSVYGQGNFTTGSGDTVEVTADLADGSVFVAGPGNDEPAQVVQADINVYGSSVLHAIDKVLLPILN